MSDNDKFNILLNLIGNIDRRLDGMDRRLGGIDQRLDKIERDAAETRAAIMEVLSASAPFCGEGRGFRVSRLAHPIRGEHAVDAV
jgi:hypothetical protein